MTSVQNLAEQIVAREGGFVNDPDDPGGATNFGVTLHTLRRLRPHQQVCVDDVRALTRDDAVTIYVEHYFTRPRIGDLPEPLWATVFDMYVNAGANAVRILQRLLNEMGQDVTVDGVIGPQTIAATHWAFDMAPNHMVDAYGIARRDYYYRIADQRPASRKFARRRDGGKGGWIIRAEEFISPRYHLTDAQHRARTGAWA
ncbi:MAG: putative secretion activating protein [Roseibaca calidilacus]|uniref:Predicted Peptidoglycan domain-containing protein n=1 Tax=Roseibaca calidilacus TaxID=1666912 RepID=A0A0P7WS86_9RHOB|nr:holin-associated N-acetylmuramidase [Roseibaca calidilacus]KPP93555.1 MAG: putative secretion activating protein [Roseibaca calidilacus]CUX80458.1 Predicted Peptidoglycan domain-containing protein [Roseibaca calidilacus]